MFSARPSRRAINRRRSAASRQQLRRAGIRQTKFSVAAEKDSSETEVISAYIKISQPPGADFIQRKCAECEKEEKGKIYLSPSGNTSSFIRSRNKRSTVCKPITDAIQSSKGAGSPLDSDTSSFMSDRLGHDFSQVKIHTGKQAIGLSEQLNAKAFTVGNDIYFNNGKFRPQDIEGKKLLAHELTHVLQQQGKGPLLIQRAEIEHRQLTWADFKGAPPAGNPYDAETHSDIHYPDLTTIKPLITETATDQDCTRKDAKAKDVPDKIFEASIGMDSKGVKASAFMSQEKSWGKPLFRDAATMKQFCTADPFTVSEIAACKTAIQNTSATRDTNCKSIADSCAEIVGKKQTFNVEIGADHFEASSAAECAKVVTTCKSIFGKLVKYTTGDGNDITSEKDCSSQLIKECIKRRKDAADALLSHEQGHFDITNVLAKKLETDVKGLVDGFAAKKTSGCGKEEVGKLAKDISTKEVVPKIKDKIKETQVKVDEIKGFYDAAKKVDVAGKLRSTQDLYDTETTHGTIEKEQAKWKANISKGNL